jgi:hypothetical protein
VTNPAIATEIHEALDVHRNLATQVALHRKSRDHIAQADDLGFREIFHLRGRIDVRGLASVERPVSADAENVRQSDSDVLVRRNVDASDTCHASMVPVLSRASALPLLVTRILANDADDAATADDLALPANFAH